jgi:hypothetical protein
MGPLQVSLQEVLTNKGRNARWTLVALKGSIATVAHFVTFALISAEKPRRTDRSVNTSV